MEKLKYNEALAWHKMWIAANKKSFDLAEKGELNDVALEAIVAASATVSRMIEIGALEISPPARRAYVDFVLTLMVREGLHA